MLAFEGGISAIVGPNGCGKSNVVDAIRWVMGEQNPRRLRGRMMEDVIFAGTESKPAVGMAEVTMTLDNSDGLAPGIYKGFSEIQITRRLYRSGESEYLLNRAACRLRDITDFFTDTGVGTRGYTVVEQGRVAEVVSTKPEERRFIFEEAAGIGKYRQRRRETESKLRATEQNLLRVTDILSELRRQIASLERMSRRAGQYKKLKARERDLELVVASEEYGRYADKLGAVERELGQLRIEGFDFDARIARADSRVEDNRREYLERERAVQQTSEALYALRSKIQSIESRIEYQRRERASLLKLSEERAAEVEQRREQQSAHTSLLSRVISEFALAEQTLTNDEAELEKRDAQLRELSERLSSLQGRREALLNRLVEIAAEEAGLESEARSLEDRGAELEQRVRQSDELLEASTVHAESRRGEELGLERQVRGSLAEREGLGRQLSQQLRALETAETELVDARAELDVARSQAEQASAQLGSVEELERGATRRVAETLEQLPEEQGRRIRGLLSAVIHAEPGVEAALEAVLADLLDAIIVDDSAAALDLLIWLRASSVARLTVLPFGDVARSRPDLAAGSTPPGTRILEMVRVDEPYGPLVERLLHDVYLVGNLGEAVSRAPAGAPAVFVTRTGEVLDRLGALTGGLRAPPGALVRSSELRRLRLAVGELEPLREAAESRAAEGTRRVATHGRELENGRNRVHTAELAVVNLEKDLERMRERAKEAFESVEEHRAGKASLVSQLDRANEEHATHGERLTAIERERALVGSQSDELRAQIAVQSRERERLEQRLVQARIGLAELGARRDQSQEARNRLQTAVDEGREWIARWTEEVRGASERAESLARSTAADEEQLASLIREEETRRAAMESMRTAYENRSADVAAAENESRTATRERESHRERVASCDLALQEARLQCEQLSARIRERFEVEVAEYAPDPEHLHGDSEERQRELERHRESLRSLGEVHLGAIEEYEEVAERNRYLSEQRADLETSIERLRNAIARINRASRSRFRTTFEAIDAQFQEMFPRMFNGGRAHLSLTEAEDVLEAGIEIAAQPPGKRLQNVNLLSGGEKALTALALLIAVFAVKPSPFFLLDEVDAALDDANVGRFNDLLRERVRSSQLLLITHNKATIEIADTLFGVTMQEPGLSKLVTVDLLP